MSLLSTYDVFAVRYGRRETMRSDVYLNFDIYGVADSPIGMDYYFWVARNADRVVVIDSGFGRTAGERRGRTMLCHPTDALRHLAIEPAEVEQVVVTHAHYDHIGNLDSMPNAEIVISSREFDFWTGPYGKRPQFASSAESDEIVNLQEAAADGRVSFVASQSQLAPGIELIEVGGHTPGQLIVLVQTRGGQAVLASDAVHYYEEFERDWPFTFVADLEAMYRGFDTLREIMTAPGSSLVAGHDPDVMNRFSPCDGELSGLAVRVG